MKSPPLGSIHLTAGPPPRRSMAATTGLLLSLTLQKLTRRVDVPPFLLFRRRPRFFAEGGRSPRLASIFEPRKDQRTSGRAPTRTRNAPRRPAPRLTHVFHKRSS